MDHAGAVAGPLIALIMLSGLAFDLAQSFCYRPFQCGDGGDPALCGREQAEPKRRP
jgi:hypothetical protein